MPMDIQRDFLKMLIPQSGGKKDAFEGKFAYLVTEGEIRPLEILEWGGDPEKVLSLVFLSP